MFRTLDDPSAARPEAAVIGAGPAGLMAAERLAAAGLGVTVYDRMPSVARKFLMAGRGGLNLTHSEPLERLLGRYGGASARLEPSIRAFPPEAMRAWCDALGMETFVGSSGRIFPRSLKSSPLLRAWLRRLDRDGVAFRLRHHWTGFDDANSLIFDTPDGRLVTAPAVTVFALGGASWPRLGGDGGWVGPFKEAGVAVAALQPANCGFRAVWTRHFLTRFTGSPLKRAALTFEGETARGEAMVTESGIEGGLIYALSARLRDAIARDGEARPTIDLRPDLDVAALAARLANPRGNRSLSTHLAKAAGLAPVAVSLLREAGPPPTEVEALARRIKAVPLLLTKTQGLDRAISTAGGVAFDELDDGFMLMRRPGVFIAGEMLDWEAPTGGYLLQGCMATGAMAGDAAARFATARPVED